MIAKKRIVMYLIETGSGLPDRVRYPGRCNQEHPDTDPSHPS
jgi:hypothetical protein